MKLVFFNNQQVTYDCQNIFEIETIVTDTNFSLNNFDVDLSGNTIYAINVNTIFDNYNNQDQAGVIIYRHLLHKFSNHQDKLKVVFISVIELDNLVKLKPENYVLNLYPFVHFRFDGNFFEDLNFELENYKNRWPQLNNASENLLSGWNLAGQKKINIKDQTSKILFIDDENLSWQHTLNNILGKDNFTTFLEGSIENFRSGISDLLNIKDNFTIEDISSIAFGKDLIDLLKTHFIVVMDFYLIENHETSDFMDSKNLKKISGAKLFQIIKKINPAIIILFHTTSNKIQYFKFFEDLGADDWINKFNFFDLDNNTKKNSAIYFTKSVNEFYDPLKKIIYDRLNNSLVKIKKVENDSNFWWKNPQENKIYVKGIMQLLYESWYLLRVSVKQNIGFEKNLSNNLHPQKYIITTGIILNLYKIREDFMDKYSDANLINKEIEWIDNYLTVIRNLASHIRHKDSLGIVDAIIYFDFITEYLETVKFTPKDSKNSTFQYKFFIKNNYSKKFTNEFFNANTLVYLIINKKFSTHKIFNEFESVFTTFINNKIDYLNKTDKAKYTYGPLVSSKNYISQNIDYINKIIELFNVTSNTNNYIDKQGFITRLYDLKLEIEKNNTDLIFIIEPTQIIKKVKEFNNNEEFCNYINFIQNRHLKNLKIQLSQCEELLDNFNKNNDKVTIMIS